MAKQVINVGTTPNDGTGDLMRNALIKANDNFTELYTGAETVAATAKTTPVDADILPVQDSAASNVKKKVTWANIKATLKTYFDSLYPSEALSNSKTYGRKNKTWVEITAGGGITDAPVDGSAYNRKDGDWAIAASGGGGEIWTALIGAYASATTFTYTSGSDKTAKLDQLSLFTCTDSAGTTRKFGYIKSSVNSSGTVTATVVSSAALASGDKDFKVAYNQKIKAYTYDVKIPGVLQDDSAASQGWWHQDITVNSYLLPVDFSVITAASGTGAALTINIYKNTTALFSSAPDLATNKVLRSQVPTIDTITAEEDISLRVLTSVGATNKAVGLQAKLIIVPVDLFTAF